VQTTKLSIDFHLAAELFFLPETGLQPLKLADDVTWIAEAVRCSPTTPWVLSLFSGRMTGLEW
jgi:hypothetical protein